MAARKRGKEAALAEAPEDERDWLASLDLDALPPGFESEVAFGWDPATDTGHRYELDAHRAYPADGFFHGTADLVGVRMAVTETATDKGTDYTARVEKVIVYDLKRFGAKVAARQSAQLALLALAVARNVGADEAEVAMLQPGSRGWIVDRHHLDALDLGIGCPRQHRLDHRLEQLCGGERSGTVVHHHQVFDKGVLVDWTEDDEPGPWALLRNGSPLTTCPSGVATPEDVAAMDPAERAEAIAQAVDQGRADQTGRARDDDPPRAGVRVGVRQAWPRG